MMNLTQLVVNAGNSAETILPALNAPPHITGAKNSLIMAILKERDFWSAPISVMRETPSVGKRTLTSVGEKQGLVKHTFQEMAQMIESGRCSPLLFPNTPGLRIIPGSPLVAGMQGFE
jgi:hypothetical protein